MKNAPLLTLAAALVFALPAQADTLTLSLAEPSQSASTPGVLAYTGTITAPLSNSAPVYLNGDAYNLDQPYSVDDSTFAGAPTVLAAGDTYTGILFEVALTDPLTDGIFNGDFSLLGGADPATQETLMTEPFSFTVSPAPSSSVTPEPPSVLLLVSGTVLLAAAARRRRSPNTAPALPRAW